jgi:CRISPR-associated protein Csx17
MSQHPIPLAGCAPVPLAHYLKALGILRLVAEDEEHGDPEAAGCWERDVFVLHGKLDREALLDFFLHHYAPTPILAPWNGGSGFHKKDNREAVEAIEKGKSERLSSFRAAIVIARAALTLGGLREKPSPEQKEQLLRSCRSHFPDDALAWLDAAFVLTDDGAKYPPLLGTGGNDGRLEFTNNLMQRLTEVIDPDTGKPKPLAESWLLAALFGVTAKVPLSKAPVGQFLPGAAGGANTTSGFDSDSAVNPWDYILMMEGALLFAAAAVRRLEGSGPGALAYPFCVRQAGVGYGSASAADEEASRAEMWLPLWERPAGLRELAMVLSEGRAQVGHRPARNGVDFARAVVTLGVDRGLAAFQRYGFQVRNGLSYFATPLDRIIVRRNARADLLSEIDSWLARLRDKAGPTAKQVPASVARALNHLESRILDLCKNGSASCVQAVLVALGQVERTLACSLAWTTGRKEQPPVQKSAPLAGLSSRWIREANDSAAEFRLAATLASVSGCYKDKEGRAISLQFRQHLEPVVVQGNRERHWLAWDDPPSSDVLWHDGDFVGVLNRIFARRLIRAEQAGKSELPDSGLPAPLPDVVAFIEGQTDDELLADLLWGLCLVDWVNVQAKDMPWLGSHDSAPAAVPSALFSLLRLAFPRRGERGDSPAVPAIPVIHRQAATGAGLEASRLTVRRLRGSGLHPALGEVALAGDAVRRAGAALLFPLSRRDFARLSELVLKPQTETK